MMGGIVFGGVPQSKKLRGPLLELHDFLDAACLFQNWFKVKSTTIVFNPKTTSFL